MLFIETPTLYSLALCCSYLQFGRASLPVPQETRNELFFPKRSCFHPFPLLSCSSLSFENRSAITLTSFFLLPARRSFIFRCDWVWGLAGDKKPQGARRGGKQSVHTAQHFLRVCPTPLRSSELTHTFFPTFFSFRKGKRSVVELLRFICLRVCLLSIKKIKTKRITP